MPKILFCSQSIRLVWEGGRLAWLPANYNCFISLYLPVIVLESTHNLPLASQKWAISQKPSRTFPPLLSKLHRRYPSQQEIANCFPKQVLALSYVYGQSWCLKRTELKSEHSPCRTQKLPSSKVAPNWALQFWRLGLQFPNYKRKITFLLDLSRILDSAWHFSVVNYLQAIFLSSWALLAHGIHNTAQCILREHEFFKLPRTNQLKRF